MSEGVSESVIFEFNLIMIISWNIHKCYKADIHTAVNQSQHVQLQMSGIQLLVNGICSSKSSVSVICILELISLLEHFHMVWKLISVRHNTLGKEILSWIILWYGWLDQVEVTSCCPCSDCTHTIPS